MGQQVAQLGKVTPHVHPISSSGGDTCWVRASECHSPPPSHPAQNIWNAFPNEKHSLPAFLACPPVPRPLKCLLSDTGTRGRDSMLPGYLGGWHPPASLGTMPGKVLCTFNLHQPSYSPTSPLCREDSRQMCTDVPCVLLGGGGGACPFGCCWLSKHPNVGIHPGALSTQSWGGGREGGAVTS